MRKAVRSLLGIVATLGLMLSAYPTVASADPGGNNGTIKIHDSATNQEDRRNEPKVCTFYIAGFNFDRNSDGVWRIDRHAQSGSGTAASGAWKADANGNWRTADMTLADGHYKAFAKQTVGPTPGGEKQKVFKVECAPAQPAAAPNQNNNQQQPNNGNKGQEKGSLPTNSNEGEQQTTVAGFENRGETRVTVVSEREVIVNDQFVTLPEGAMVGADRFGNPVVIINGQMFPISAVLGIQTAPLMGSVSPISELPMGVGEVRGEAAAPTVAGVQQLPATSTANAQSALAGLGVVLTALGAFLLRRGRRAD